MVSQCFVSPFILSIHVFIFIFDFVMEYSYGFYAIDWSELDFRVIGF